MFVVLFEVQPKREQWDRYLELAAMLRPELAQICGFIDNERYASERSEGRLLSLSTWEDEKALVRWRTQAIHHGVQRQGRFEVFEDYNLRVGEVLSDSDQTNICHSPRRNSVNTRPPSSSGSLPSSSYRWAWSRPGSAMFSVALPTRYAAAGCFGVLHA